MAALTGNTVASTYTSVIKTLDNGAVGSSLKNLTDGAGNVTTLWTSNQATTVSGSFAVTGSSILSGSVTVKGSTTLSGSVNISGSLIMNTTGSLVLPLTASASPATGSVYFNFSANKLYAYNGTAWVTASLG